MSNKQLVFAILMILIIWIIFVTIIHATKHDRFLPKKADIVIIGSGPGGCVMSRRLHEKYPDKKIVVLERGKDYRNDRNIYRVEAALIAAYSEPYSEVIPTDFPGVIASAAKMSGGNSSHNFSLAVRGSDHFYETHWSSEMGFSMEEIKCAQERVFSTMQITPLPSSIDMISRVLPTLGKLFQYGLQEIQQGLDVVKHAGLLRANEAMSEWILDAMEETAQDKGKDLPRSCNYNSGIGPCTDATPQLFVDKTIGIRNSVNIAYLPKHSVTVVEFADVDFMEVVEDNNYKHKINLKDGRCIKAKKVILSAGGLYSPHLLLKSGIGSCHEIGTGLLNHYGCSMVLAVKQTPFDNYDAYKGINCVRDFSSGPLAFVAGRDKKVRKWQIVSSGSTLTNLDFLRAQNVNVDKFLKEGYKFITFLAWDLSPKARGKISVKKNSDQPKIELSMFENNEDNESIVEVLRFMGKMFKKLRSSYDEFFECCSDSHCENGSDSFLKNVVSVFPKESVFNRNDFDELLQAAKTGVSSTDHYSGTCKFGKVLGHNFSVIGHPDLHVVDASAFPSIPDANTEFPTLLLAELAATRI